jgi:hypothetical protein
MVHELANLKFCSSVSCVLCSKIYLVLFSPSAVSVSCGLFHIYLVNYLCVDFHPLLELMYDILSI